MARYAFRIVNVFAEAPLAGNPLAVFEDGRGLDDATVQALALQFNLSETTFILPSTLATARVRIFTPTFEMPFAGHPTLGTAHVVRGLKHCGDAITLEMRAGVIPVRAEGDRWTLGANAPRTRPVAASRAELAAMLGLEIRDLAAQDSPGQAPMNSHGRTTEPLWVDTGSEQLVIPLASADAVRRASPRAELMGRHATATLPDGTSRSMAYAWAESAPGQVLCRFFFLKYGAVVEDPGTGSACANLGGWLVATGARRPCNLTLDQGEAVGRPCKLGLTVDEGGAIFVSGRVVELGRGTIEL
jgi:PhzF family phenazine biosynthesis protein